MAKIPSEIKWLDKHRIGAEEDIPNLETAAAINEFQHKMPRQDAEAKAHKDYMSDKAVDSAAHHYLGMRAAIAGRNDQAAAQHGEAYAKAMKHLGLSSSELPPQNVMDRVEKLKQKVYSFKGHSADELLGS